MFGDLRIAFARTGGAHEVEDRLDHGLAHRQPAYQALGAQGNAMIIFGKYTAFPHGSVVPQTLHEGDMVLVDDGCSVEGYQSDITRTTVFGKPTARQSRRTPGCSSRKA